MTEPPFTLHAQLASDTVPVCWFDLCHVLLMKDANYPWLILVPARADIREVHELVAADQLRLMQEISEASRQLQAITGAHKMNVAALGNMVPQLHVHVIARFEGDTAWPKPVWGVAPVKPYAPEALAQRLAALKQAFGVSAG